MDYMNRELKYLPVYETGKLRLGNGAPGSEDYDSLADFCYGDDCVEIRIPWALLNVANPADMLIPDDYYENYGVDFIGADCFYMGVSKGGSSEIELEEFSLSWEDRTYEETIRISIEIVQSAWR